MLKHFPEYTHVHRIAEVRQRSEVLPVGCDLARLGEVAGRLPSSSDEAPVILWNQRWEYDKGPQTFFKALYQLADEGNRFKLIVAGKSDRKTADEFEDALERLHDRVLHFGYASEREYVRLLRQSDIVVSTAIHEFFGISVVEAVYAGCFPVLPRRLSYPEILPDEVHDRCLYEEYAGLMSTLRWALGNRLAARELAAALRPAMARFDWASLIRRYDDAVDDLARLNLSS
jgi:glycosyltransferase involved in cell wall biosynthesis